MKKSKSAIRVRYGVRYGCCGPPLFQDSSHVRFCGSWSVTGDSVLMVGPMRIRSPWSATSERDTSSAEHALTPRHGKITARQALASNGVVARRKPWQGKGSIQASRGGSPCSRAAVALHLRVRQGQLLSCQRREKILWARQYSSVLTALQCSVSSHCLQALWPHFFGDHLCL